MFSKSILILRLLSNSLHEFAVVVEDFPLEFIVVVDDSLDIMQDQIRLWGNKMNSENFL